ncbi:MAG: helicase [Hyphomicrobiales bacterium]|nr:MAG: helicase [Hyphomicrobiales bacterium]
MLAHPTGIIGLPLRLLAREVYGRVVDRLGADAVALVTGEEKIVPQNPRFWVYTVEAMPRETDCSFAAIDEVQLAGDFERGRVFTDRLLNLRGTHETLLLGAATVRGLLEKLLPGLNVVTRPRMSVLSYSGQKKITRLPPRSAVVAFSADEVYAIAELIRRQRGGAAVVLGALSPRTRNAQVALFQSGDVEFLVATDAIGMGLNLDVDHVAFAGNRKFDGYQYRALTPAEFGQIAGRAGRHTHDGTFGVTGRVDPFEDSLVEALETHAFDPVRVLQWRNPLLDFTSTRDLRASLDLPSREEGLTRAPPGEDLVALEHAERDSDTMALARGAKAVELLWDVCQVPDYRRIAPANHAELITTLFGYLARHGTIADEWFDRQVAYADRIEGDIDSLSNRIAHIRTWTFIANRPGWLKDPIHWQERTRAIEDRLSDALHERLTQRFVDRRTSVLMRRLREKAMLEAEINATGDVLVEGQHVGHLQGFRFTPDPTADGPEVKALRAAAMKALAQEIENRSERLSRAPDTDLLLTDENALRWNGEVVGRLAAGDDVLRPQVLVLADEQLTGPARDRVQARLDLFVAQHLATLLKPLLDLRDAEDIEGLARGVAFRLVENLGSIDRHQISEDVRQLDQNARAGLRKYGVRFGAHHIYVPALLKPAPSRLLMHLWALKNADGDVPGLAELPQISAAGRTSVPADETFPLELCRIAGYRVCGPRAVRLDILERLADIIRPIVAWRPGPNAAPAPEGAIPEGGGFTVTVGMTSLLGCAGEDFSATLKALGYRLERRKAEGFKAPPTRADLEAAEQAAAAEAKPEDEAAPAETETAPSGEGEASATPETAVEPAAEAPAEPEVTEAAPKAEDAAEETAPAGEETPAEAVETVTPEIDASEADAGETSAEASAEAAPAEAEKTEPEFVEIWRPGRAGGSRRPPRRGHDGEAGEGEARQGDRRQRQNQGQNQGQKQGDDKGDRPRGEKRFDKRKGGGKRPEKFGGKPGGKRGDRRSDAPRTVSASPPKKALDPDSPFAALAALKADMQKGKKDK